MDKVLFLHFKSPKVILLPKQIVMDRWKNIEDDRNETKFGDMRYLQVVACMAKLCRKTWHTALRLLSRLIGDTVA